MSSTITYNDSRPGDTIRFEWDEPPLGQKAIEAVLREGKGNWYGGADHFYLLDRPRKLIHEKGKTLYVKVDYTLWRKGDVVVVASDYFEDDAYVRIRSGASGVVALFPGELTDVKPETYRKIAQSEIDKLRAARAKAWHLPTDATALAALGYSSKRFLEHAAAAPRV